MSRISASNSNSASNAKLLTRAQILGNHNNLQGEINACSNGARVEIDIRLARNLLRICRQAMAQAPENYHLKAPLPQESVI